MAQETIMKLFSKLLIAGLIALSAAAAAPLAADMPSARPDVASACSAADDGGILSMLTPELIAAYEKNIAGEELISGMPDLKLERLAERFGTSAQRMRGLILLRDMAARTGKGVSLAELAKESDLELLRRAKQCADIYLASLSDEEKEHLEREFRAALQNSPARIFL